MLLAMGSAAGQPALQAVPGFATVPVVVSESGGDPNRGRTRWRYWDSMAR
jgi:hypothetical protein